MRPFVVAAWSGRQLKEEFLQGRRVQAFSIFTPTAGADTIPNDAIRRFHGRRVIFKTQKGIGYLTKHADFTSM